MKARSGRVLSPRAPRRKSRCRVSLVLPSLALCASLFLLRYIITGHFHRTNEQKIPYVDHHVQHSRKLTEAAKTYHVVPRGFERARRLGSQLESNERAEEIGNEDRRSEQKKEEKLLESLRERAETDIQQANLESLMDINEPESAWQKIENMESVRKEAGKSKRDVLSEARQIDSQTKVDKDEHSFQEKLKEEGFQSHQVQNASIILTAGGTGVEGSVSAAAILGSFRGAPEEDEYEMFKIMGGKKEAIEDESSLPAVGQLAGNRTTLDDEQDLSLAVFADTSEAEADSLTVIEGSLSGTNSGSELGSSTLSTLERVGVPQSGNLAQLTDDVSGGGSSDDLPEKLVEAFEEGLACMPVGLPLFDGDASLISGARAYGSCAFVGNAGTLRAAERGGEIDSHDLVLRSNQAPTGGKDTCSPISFFRCFSDNVIRLQTSLRLWTVAYPV